MARLDDGAIQANAKEIRAMAGWSTDKTRGTGNCLICAEYIPARTAARISPGRRLCAHAECVRRPVAGDLLLDGVIEVD
jgi:hypothetical protein